MRGKHEVINLLVGDEDLESLDDLCERNTLVGLPVLKRLGILNEDNEVILLALVVDLGFLGVSARHDVRFVCWKEFGY